ncbi:MAG TPA: carotenoid 1,2-hydratase [Ramlibacter sp.]|nr:carotenoid 1,2-hydratase [Ramlibacter sp.]
MKEFLSLTSGLRRRAILAGGLAAPLARALPQRGLVFPQDHGAHPDLRTEWWYVTGHAQDGDRLFGFQVTFFRTRVDATQGMQSKFAARQLLFAHAAVTDVKAGKLVHDQRIARQGFGIAQAQEGDAALRIRDWSLVRQGEAWNAVIPAAGFRLDLRCAAVQPVLLQGRQGLSRKGPQEKQASYYYSQPQLAVTGLLSLQGREFRVTGKAWMDHEWSEELLHPDAVGWDWIGMNLDDGAALTAFRLRRRDGSTVWDGGSYRSARGDLYIATPGETEFRAGRTWTSALSNATYPVEWRLRTPADFYTVRALVDNQELDSRASTGAIYWEGLSDLVDSNGRRVGRGYLEMTGYAGRLRM